jgi:dipeptidyl aminopeptidase/acylaminoacyl peptidase
MPVPGCLTIQLYILPFRKGADMKLTLRGPVNGIFQGSLALILAFIPAVLFSPGCPAQDAPLVPRAVFDAPAEHDLLTISPDGKMIAYTAPSDQGSANIWVEDLATHQKRAVTRAQRGIYGYEWAFDNTHVLYASDENGNEDYHLYSADLKSGAIRDLTPFQGIRSEHFLLEPSHPDEVLVSMNLRDRKVFDVYRVNLETGATTLQAENPGDVIGWTADSNLVVRAATAFNDNLETVVRVRDNAKAPWRDLLKIPFAEASFLGQVNGGNIIVGFSQDGKRLVVGSSKGSPTNRLVELDAATGKELRVLAGDPQADLWQVFATRFIVLRDPRDHHVQAASFNYLKPEWRAVDPAVEADLKYLSSLQEGAFIIANQDLSGNKWAVWYLTNGPASFYLYDRSAHKATLFFQDRPQLAKYKLAEMRALTIPARDGFKLVSYLTLPPGNPAQPLPLILQVHGGPWARDEWGFDPAVQFLANRGYAVLQVNFRASTINVPYMNAGNEKIGAITDDDLTDGVNWAVKQGIADPKRIAIAGTSFGGYSVLRALSLHPDLYACGVDVVGPVDLATLMNSIPDYWKPVKKRWLRRIGDVTTDQALNEKLSPLYHASAIRAPLLIGHGQYDPRVKLSQSEKIVDTIRKNGGKATFVVYSDEGHGFTRPENNLDFDGRMEEFLHGCLGGRFQPWEKVPGSTAEVK